MHSAALCIIYIFYSLVCIGVKCVSHTLEGNVNDTLYFLINTGLTKDDISWCLVHFSKFGSSCESYLTWIRGFYFCLFFAKCELLLKWTVKTSTLKLVSHNSINRNGLRISAVFRYIPAAKRCVSTLPCLSLVLQHNALG